MPKLTKPLYLRILVIPGKNETVVCWLKKILIIPGMTFYMFNYEAYKVNICEIIIKQ